jgi:hypothetical protein
MAGAAVGAALLVALPVVGAPLAAAQSSVLEGYSLSVWGRDGWGRGCQAKDAHGNVVTVPSGTIMELQVPVTNPDGTKTTVTVHKKCEDGEWKNI